MLRVAAPKARAASSSVLFSFPARRLTTAATMFSPYKATATGKPFTPSYRVHIGMTCSRCVLRFEND